MFVINSKYDQTLDISFIEHIYIGQGNVAEGGMGRDGRNYYKDRT